MSCHTAPWLCAPTPTATTTTGSSKFYKSTTIFCCVNSPADSSQPSQPSSSVWTGSSSRRWYNPLKKRPLDQPPEIVRHWINSDYPFPSHETFTVVSYNILGDRNAFKHRDLYSNVPFSYMKWDHRRRVICNEIIGWNPDIVCLQEVDKYFDLLSIMEKEGYAGSYKRRTGDTVDGCAMFWKAEKFRLLEGESIEFKQYGLRDNVAQLSLFESLTTCTWSLKFYPEDTVAASTATLNFINLRNIPSLSKFKMCEDESRKLLVGNIHVLYNPSRGDVKLGQIRFLSLRAHILSEKWGNVPVVLAGDFNSTPQSAMYQFLSSSELNIMLYDRRELSGQRNCHPAQVFDVEREISSSLILMDRFLKGSWTDEEVKVATGSADCHIVVHPLKLKSSYATVKSSTGTRGFNGEPLATSYHSKFLGTVDYLWYSDGVVPTRVLDTLPIEILLVLGGLPCREVGSDHLALVSEFAFTQGTEEGNNTTSMATSDVAFPASEEDDNGIVM